MDHWRKVEDELPEFEEIVLVYYEIEGKGIKTIKCFEIGRLTSITNRKESSTPSWEDRSYNPITPTHWMPLPEAPK